MVLLKDYMFCNLVLWMNCSLLFVFAIWGMCNVKRFIWVAWSNGPIANWVRGRKGKMKNVILYH